MKRWIALLLALVLCLSLAACGEEEPRRRDDDDDEEEIEEVDEELLEHAALYEKYEPLIQALEQKNFSNAINQIAAMSHAEMEANKEPAPEPVQILCGQWYVREQGRPVQNVSFAADGTCTLDGAEMTWTQNNAETYWLNGYILSDGKVQYIFEIGTPNEDQPLARLSLWTAEETEYGVSSDDHVGNFTNCEMIPQITYGWKQLTMFEDMPNYLSVNFGNIRISDVEYFWTPAETSDGLLTIETFIRDGSSTGEYTLTLAERDGYRVLNVTNNATGVQALYCRDIYEETTYDSTWPEAIYRTAREALNNYANGWSIYKDEKYLSGNEAMAYIYELFSQTGGYLDSADYMARFTILPSLLTSINEINVNQLNDASKNQLYYCSYMIDGRLDHASGDSVIERYGITYSGRQYFTYDTDGRISEIIAGYRRDDISAIGTPTYDEAGRLLAMSVQTGSEAYSSSFTYDDQGRLISSETHAGDYYGRTYAYTYDEAGLLIQKVWTSQNGNFTTTEDYIYENGLLIQTNTTYKYRYSDPYTATTVFTNDEQGRPISAVYTTTNPNYTYKSTTLEYIYEDIYFLDTTGLVDNQ